MKTLNPEYEEDTAEEVQNVHFIPHLFILVIHLLMFKDEKVYVLLVPKSENQLIISYSSRG